MQLSPKLPTVVFFNFSGIDYLLFFIHTSPVSSRIGFGAWHASCSGVGSFSKWLTMSQKGLDSFVPCTEITLIHSVQSLISNPTIQTVTSRDESLITWMKLNSPGPSVVPAAKA